MERNKDMLIVITLVLLSIIISSTSVIADDVKVDKNVYLIILNKYTLEDIEYMPNLNQIINNGSIGLMNTRGLVGYNGAEGYLTINASNKAISTYEDTEVYNINKEYKEIYERRFGEINNNSNLVNINLSSIYDKNKNNNYEPYIGALGDNLHEKGYFTASFGNADTIDYIMRPGSLIPMDSKGLIDFGNVDNILINDKDMPYGFKTDYDKMLEEILNINNKASLIVIDTGDLDRLSLYSSQMSEEIFIERRQDILSKIDNFIGELKKSIEKENSLLMVLSPNSGESKIDNSRLSPIVLWGSDLPKGILLSPTTKKNGIVTNVDIAPTIADYLGAPKTGMIGNTIRSKEMDENLEYVTNLKDRVNTTYISRHKTLLTFSIFAIIIILICTILLLFKVKVTDHINKVLYFLLILLISIPLTLILSSVLNINNLLKFISINGFLLLIISFIVYKIKYSQGIFVLIGITYLILVTDLITNNLLSQYSVMAADPIVGARYFGIGNELVGVFLGVTTILLGVFLNKKGSRLITTLMLIFSVFLVGYPKLGANVGGSISLLFASLYFILELWNKNISLKKTIGLGLLVIIFILFMGYIDIKFNTTPTHLGKALIMVGENKGAALSIALRKILMNIKLIGSSIWAKALLVAIFSNIVLLFMLGERIAKVYEKNKGLSIGLISAVVGSIIGFLFNDSGVVLSALTMILVTAVLLLLLIKDEREKSIE